MQNFVLSGKAKTVFRIINIKTFRERIKEREQDLINMMKKECQPTCGKPDNVTCKEIRQGGISWKLKSL